MSGVSLCIFYPLSTVEVTRGINPKKPPPQEVSVLKALQLLSMQGRVLRFLRHILLYIFIEEERKLINRFYPDASFVRGFFQALQGLFVRTGPSQASANPMIC
jgi:hypothetical protein